MDEGILMNLCIDGKIMYGCRVKELPQEGSSVSIVENGSVTRRKVQRIEHEYDFSFGHGRVNPVANLHLSDQDIN